MAALVMGATQMTFAANEGKGEQDLDSLKIEEMQEQMLRKALERNGGSRKKAAEEVGMPERTFYRKLKKYGLDK